MNERIVATLADVNLHSARDVVALGAPDGATLRVPERCLSVVARITRHVRAWAVGSAEGGRRRRWRGACMQSVCMCEQEKL
jgi:hypothetical protein